jgi:glucans biosynthesis protein
VQRNFFPLLILLLPIVANAKIESAEVTLDYIARKAEARARLPFRSPRLDLPESLRADQLDYDKYRRIQFRHPYALWYGEGLPFNIEFFHPGYLYQEPVRVHEFAGSFVQALRFNQDSFNYDNLTIKGNIPAETGYAGFKVLGQLNNAQKVDEIGSFLGASYFRLLGKGQRYGQSARGLALDSGETDRPEEFPIFTDWWLGKPYSTQQSLHLFALLDSVSCAGAFEFTIVPGETTVATVDAVLFFRNDDTVHAVNASRPPIKTIGIAPLTSMFWFGENSERKFDDYRPEVHDSDGLLVRMGNGETLWRPLNNANMMRHQVFAAKSIRGFGLLQRDRDFTHYQDLFNHYHKVPSVWVEPRGNWGEGEVHLVELSTKYEGLDNVVAFWNPKNKPKPMEPFRIGYTLAWTRETDMQLSPNKVISTRVGADVANPKWRLAAIDFAGPRLNGLSEKAPLQAIANCSPNAVITESQVFQNPYEKSWRAIIKFEPKAGNADPVDLRCTLKSGEEVLTETWTYHWSPL